MTKQTWIIFTAVVILLFGGLFYLSSRDKVDVSKIDVTKAQMASDAAGGIADHVSGPEDAKVTLIEYGDYQCPGCGSAHEPIKTLTDKYKGQVRFVFRNFPLVTMHPNARAAAAAAETAGLFGKYWEMHDALYENQSNWQSSSASDRLAVFASYAEQIGIERQQFIDMFNKETNKINRKINFDTALGKKAGVSGTPTFYLNGKELNQYFKDGKLVESGTSGAGLVWSDADALDTLIIQPALQEAGVALPTTTK